MIRTAARTGDDESRWRVAQPFAEPRDNIGVGIELVRDRIGGFDATSRYIRVSSGAGSRPISISPGSNQRSLCSSATKS